MDFSLYELLLDLPELRIQGVEIEEKSLKISCELRDKKGQLCPKCKRIVSVQTPKYVRTIRDLNISGRSVYLLVNVHQYMCECGRHFMEGLDFVNGSKNHTKRQAKWIIEMSRKQSHKEVGRLVQMSHKTVERICYDSVGERIINWDKIKRIGIDEFAFKKGHKDFITILVDLDTHEIIDILEYRDKSSLRTYFQSLGVKICKRVEDFCSDMWGPFQDLAAELFPNALIHIDRFHWTIYLNKIVDNFRKELRKSNKEEEAFKRLKWKLIKAKTKLSSTDKKDLKDAFEISTELEEVYEMKNMFQAIFDAKFSYPLATQQISIWKIKAKELKNKHIDEFITFFERHEGNILNYFKRPITSAVVEGKNNLLRTIKRFTFNMTNFEHFKSRVFAFNP
ncbi:MAG: ISL3 family transposase [Saprospiraceae bacterium]